VNQRGDLKLDGARAAVSRAGDVYVVCPHCGRTRMWKVERHDAPLPRHDSGCNAAPSGQAQR
jgi:hypothetical protein